MSILEKYLVSLQEITLAQKRLLDDHRLDHAHWSMIRKRGKPLTIRKTGKPLDEKEVVKRHIKHVREMFRQGFRHNLVDSLDNTLPKDLQKKSGQSKKVYATKGTYKSLVSEAVNLRNMSGLYLVEPHAKWVFEKKKSLILKKKNYDSYIGKDLVLCGEKAYGLIKLKSSKLIDKSKFRSLRSKHLVTDSEVRKWWGTYDLRVYLFNFRPFKKLVSYHRPRGVQTIIKVVKFKEKPEL